MYLVVKWLFTIGSENFLFLSCYVNVRKTNDCKIHLSKKRHINIVNSTKTTNYNNT